MGDNDKIPGPIASHIELLRPGWWMACFFIGVTPGMLAIFWDTGSLDNFFQWKTLVWVFGYWASVVGIYSYNDAVGIKEDAVINPKRPLPSRRVTRSGALKLGGILVILGILAWWIAFENILSSIIQIMCVLTMIIYSFIYKDNFYLGLAAALIPLGVWIALAPFHWIAIAMFIMLFFWEATLDVPENLLHFEGDKRAHPHTYAIRMGPKRFIKLGVPFALITVASMAWLAIMLEFNLVFLIFAGISGLILIKSQVSIQKDLSPMKLGQSLGMVMLAIFIVNMGIIAYTLAGAF